jgi:hypothetical protein
MMVVIEVLLILAILTAIGYPLFVQPKTSEGVEDGDEFHKLVAAKESAFVALKDLDFDYKTGKLDDEDYQKLKSRYETEAVSILKRIDETEKGGAKETRPTARQARFCSSCGAKADTDDRFCRSCGKPVKN